MNFSNSSRVGHDASVMTQEALQYNAQSSYMLKNFYVQDCGMRKPIEFATGQLTVNYSAAGGFGNQCGIGGCNIDQNSQLLLGSLQTHPKYKLTLHNERPFKTIPYLGKGKFDPDVESKLFHTDSFSNQKKSVTKLSEISYMPYTNYPLIPEIQKTINDPRYLVEGVAMDGWVRGGEATKKK
jgi:hypothetical protein